MEQDESNLWNLEMAKKRDHKIMITDEAIEKVPMIEYREISEDVYPLLQDLAKEVLRLSKEENDSNEVAITFSLNYKQLINDGKDYIGIAYGDEHSVDPRLNAVADHIIRGSYGCVVIMLHNHPSLSKFSLEDVKFFLGNNTIKMMVVVTNLGGISYLVKKGAGYFERKAIDLYNESVDLHNVGTKLRDYQKAVSFFLTNCYKAGIIYDDR